MTILLIILGSLLVTYLLYKFFLEITSISIVFIGGMLLGFVLMFFNFQIGLNVFLVCVVLFIVKWIIFLFAGVISAFVVTPIWLIIGGIKGFFSRIFK